MIMNDNVSQNQNNYNNNEYHDENKNTFENYRNETQNEIENNEIPSTLLVCRTIQNPESFLPMKVLLGSGASHAMIHSRCLPPGATPSVITSDRTKFQTVAGVLDSKDKYFWTVLYFQSLTKQKESAVLLPMFSTQIVGMI